MNEAASSNFSKKVKIGQKNNFFWPIFNLFRDYGWTLIRNENRVSPPSFKKALGSKFDIEDNRSRKL